MGDLVIVSKKVVEEEPENESMTNVLSAMKRPSKREVLNEVVMEGWYPSNPNLEDNKDGVVLIEAISEAIPPPEHKLWSSKLKYTSKNIWPHAIDKAKREGCRRFKVEGVEVKDLPPSHFLCGEQGLFATRKFSKFDILGEYTGLIVGFSAYGHYVACLEDKPHDKSLGIDAEIYGNEMRFINSYINIGFNANLTMRTAYCDTFPRIMLVFTEDVEVGDELLLDYGAAYNNAYIFAAPVVPLPAPRKATEEEIRAMMREMSGLGGGKDEQSESESDDPN